MEFRQAIVHYIHKARDQEERNIPSVLTLRPAVLPLNERVVKLSSTLVQLYNKGGTRAYGTFHEDEEAYPLSRLVRNYADAHWNFVDVTHTAMRLLKRSIDEAALATGGYMFFARYEHEQNQWMVIASLKNKPGFAFNGDLDLSDQEHLDLDRLHEMARINLTAWTEGGERYLSFLKRRQGNDDFTNYFRNFVGCSEFTQSKVLTGNLLEALRAHWDAQNLSAEDKQRQREIAYRYLEDKRVANEGVDVAGLSRRLSDDTPDAFSEFVVQNDDRFPITLGFEPDRNIYKRLHRIAGSDGRVNISFDADLLGQRVLYDPANDQLVIREIPPQLRRQLENL